MGIGAGQIMREDKKLLMVTISGPDRPGITAALTQVLMKPNVEIASSTILAFD
jgi:predicted amino acid-binding ACT domain protein